MVYEEKTTLGFYLFIYLLWGGFFLLDFFPTLSYGTSRSEPVVRMVLHLKSG